MKTELSKTRSNKNKKSTPSSYQSPHGKITPFLKTTTVCFKFFFLSLIRWRLEPSSRQPLRDPDRHHHSGQEERSGGGHTCHFDREGTPGSGQVEGASQCGVWGGGGLQMQLRLKLVSGTPCCAVEHLLRPCGFPPLLHHLLLLRHSHVVQCLPGVQWGADVLAQDYNMPLPHHLLPHAHHAHGAVSGTVLGCGAGVLGLQWMVAGGARPGERLLRLGMWEAGTGGLFTLQYSRAARLRHSLWHSAEQGPQWTRPDVISVILRWKAHVEDCLKVCKCSY